MRLDAPWELVDNLMPGPHKTYRRGPMTVIIEHPDRLTPFDWHVSVSIQGRRPLDAEVAVVLEQLGITDRNEVPSVVNPFARHFFGHNGGA